MGIRKNCFILIENQLYINVEQGILKLCFFLFTMTKPFAIFERKSGIHIFNFLPITVIRAIRVLQFTFNFYNKKKKFKESGNTISTVKTNYYGHCLLQLRQGEQKIFNFRDKVVITSFPRHGAPIEVDKVICNARIATQCSLAPRVINWDIGEQYIIEEYINHRRPSYSFNNLEKIYSETFPILEKILFSTTPDPVKINSYTQKRFYFIESLIKKHQLNNPDFASIIQKTIRFLDFIKFMIENYKRVEEIILVSSHGDFWEGNILLNNKYARVIDWSTLGKRSFYFDYYYFLFMLASNKSGFDKVDKEGITQLADVLAKSINAYYEEIKRKSNCSSLDIRNIQYAEIYRYLFYLELIELKLVENNPNEEAKSMNEIITWISRFELIEEIINSHGASYISS
ncbi:hypothetical protein [Virgibacillus salinus]|uniref:Ecdysteroid kinase n=1 Tax=Virgibacillus salinus TaxID=553311 RepID=A0A1H0Y484_9BACI|nr:hypothetical protein [Virgibacillus salinus]SDQ09979.1 Ecdysteroid kinase [Virgibacillus salinus]